MNELDTVDSILCSMDYIDRRLSAVEEIIKVQSVEKCRRNVFETLGKLKMDHPDKSQYIDDKFKEYCLKYKKDFKRH